MSGVIPGVYRAAVRYWAVAFLAVSAVLVVGQGSAKAAEPIWSKPPATLSQSIGAPDNIITPKVAVNDSEDAIAVWAEKKENAKQQILAAHKAPGANGFSPGTVISKSDQDASQPDIAADELGNVMVVWRSSDSRVYGSYKQAGGDFGQPQQLSDIGVKGNPKVTVDGNGKFTVAWIRKVNLFSKSRAVEVIDKTPNGSFTSPTKISNAVEGMFGLRAATNEAGDTALVWLNPGPPQTYPQGTVTPYKIKVGYRPANGQFGSEQSLQPQYDLLAVYEQPDTSAEIAIDGQGRTYVTWNRFDYGSTDFQVRFTVRSAGSAGTFGSQKTLDTLSTQSSINAPRVVVDKGGNAVVTWVHDTAPYLVAASVPANGGQVFYEAFAKDSREYDLSVDQQGNAYAVWIVKATIFGVESSQVKAAYRPVDQEFGQPVALSGLGTEIPARIDLAVSSDGYVAADWLHKPLGSSSTQVQAAWKVSEKIDIDEIDPGNDDNWPPKPGPVVDPAPFRDAAVGKQLISRKVSKMRSKSIRALKHSRVNNATRNKRNKLTKIRKAFLARR